MKHIEDSFKGVNDLTMRYQMWIPDGTPKAVVQYVCGYASHPGRITNVATALGARYFVTCSSENQGAENINHVEKYEHFVENQKIFYDLIREKFPKLPHLMIGMSMGSAIARLFCVKFPGAVKALVLAGSGLKEAGKSAIIKGLAKFLNVLIPRKAPVTVDLSKDISRDPEVVKAYQNDPLVFKKPTVRMGVEMMKCFKKANEMVDQITIPVLFQSGSADKIVLGVEELAPKFVNAETTVKIYDGLYHEVYNELKADRDVVLKDLGDWLDRCVTDLANVFVSMDQAHPE